MQVSQKRNNKNKVKKTKKQQRQEAQGQLNNESSPGPGPVAGNLNSNSGPMSGNNQQPPLPPQQQQQQPPHLPPQQPQQQPMRPIGSPNSSSSGSRSMSPAVGGQQNLQMPPRPSSSHSQMPNQPPSGPMPPQQQQQQPPISQNQMNSGGSPVGPQSQQPLDSGASGITSPGRPPSSGPPQQQPPQNYPTPPPPQGQQPLPHMHGGYKMGGPNGPPQGMSSPYPPPPQSQYSQQGSYSPRTQYPGYGPPPPNSMSPGPGHQYAGRPMPNHVGPPGSHPQYGGYQGWAPPPPPQGGNPGMMPNHIQGKNIGPPQSPSQQTQGQPPQGGPQVQQQGSPAQSPQHQGPPSQIGPQRQLGYLKQHLQHKGGYGGSQSPTPQQSHPPMQGYGNGPGMHPPTSMGPPHHMGPPMGPPVSQAPPVSTPSAMGGPNHMEGPPPQMGQMPPHVMPPHHTSDPSQDNGPGSVTSIVTTGPDGAPLDEGSQQSTLSNTSIASSEEQGPKSRKGDMLYGPPHMTPNASNASASPGPGHTAGHAEDFEMGSPTSWPRPPVSPVFNSHVPPTPESYRSTKKSDSLAKLYDMDDNPDRRVFLDKLLACMDELGKPITACPTISKQPLDLYKLYIYVKERGGFSEVCKVTKSKTWKDISGLLGIGASSSAAYTLRKHYIKNILPFECKYDRGEIDPNIIIQSIETGAKKKQPKQTSVPSPGSSNSQDSFPAPGSGGGSLDGYGGGYPSNYPPTPGQQAEYSMSRPSSQSNAQSPHSGAPYQQGQYNQYMPPEQQYPGGQYPQNQYPPNSSNRAMYPPHYGPPETDVNMPPNAGPPTGAPNDPYRSYPQQYPMPPQQQQSQRPPYGPQPPQSQPNVQPPPQQAGSPSASSPAGTSPQQSGPMPPASSQPGLPSITNTQSQQQPPAIATSASSHNTTTTVPSSGGPMPPNSHHQPSPAPPQSQAPPQQPPNQMTGPPTAPMVGGPVPGAPPYQAQGPPPQDYYRPPDQPRRHPDFTKDPSAQPYSPYGHQRPQMYGGWPNSGAQYRGQYPPQGGPPPQQWQSGPGQRPPMSGSGGWDNRYPPNQQPYPQHQQSPQWSGAPPQGPPIRPPQRGGKPFAMPPPQQGQPGSPMNKMQGQYPGQGPPQAQPSHMMQPQHPHHPHHPHHSPHMQQGPPHPHSGQPPSHHPQQATQPSQQNMMQPKRDIVFPPDSVEATTPLLYRRKRLTKCEIGQVDPWRIFMALRSGLLGESTWALDVLNVLLFDDTTVAYFGLTHLPGLLNLLLEHFQKSLSDMFDTSRFCGDNNKKVKTSCNNKNKSDNSDLSNNNFSLFAEEEEEEEDEIDLGSVTDIPNPEERILVLKSTNNYTMQSRKGIPVKIQEARSDIFVLDKQKDWDKLSNKDYYVTASLGDDPWTMGQQEPNSCDYIMDCFKAEFANIPFARYIKSSKTSNKLKSVNNSNNNLSEKTVSDNKHRTSNSKIMRLSDDVNNRCNNQVKKEAIDSDCRQVDMDLDMERIPNGPQTSTSGANSSDSDNNNKRVREESMGEETDEDEFNVKSTVKDPAKVLKRRRISDYEDECYTRDEASLHLITESQDALARRCICISTILRNLTFVPGNELEFARSAVFLAILGKLLLIHHEHPIRTKKQRNYDREEDADFTDSCSSLQGEQEWWWDYLIQIRENMLVSLANIAGHMELCNFDEFISRPVLDGLLHWAVCPAAHGQDPFPTLGNHTALSPQRLALEALCKLCVTDANVDLVIATPPFSRLEKLCAVLTRQLCKNEDQVLREFSVNLLHYLAAADSTMARTVAKQSPCVSYLVAFIEQAEQTALGVANNHGINFLRENPDSMGTSLDMLRRAAGTLLHLAKHPDNRPLFMQQEQRLLGLVMSHILDQQVALIISRVLFQCSRGTGPLTTTQLEQQYSAMNSNNNNNNNNNNSNNNNSNNSSSSPVKKAEKSPNPPPQNSFQNLPQQASLAAQQTQQSQPQFQQLQSPQQPQSQQSQNQTNLRPLPPQSVTPRTDESLKPKLNSKTSSSTVAQPSAAAAPTTTAATTTTSSVNSQASTVTNIQQTVTASS